MGEMYGRFAVLIELIVATAAGTDADWMVYWTVIECRQTRRRAKITHLPLRGKINLNVLAARVSVHEELGKLRKGGI